MIRAFQRLLLSIFTVIFIAGGVSMAKAADLENTLYLDLKDGRVVIEMLPDVAPKHVKRIKELVRQPLVQEDSGGEWRLVLLAHQCGGVV